MTFRSCSQSPSDFACQKHNDEAAGKDKNKREVVHMSHEPPPKCDTPFSTQRPLGTIAAPVLRWLFPLMALNGSAGMRSLCGAKRAWPQAPKSTGLIKL